MTLKELATELYTSERVLRKWMKETGLPEYFFSKESPDQLIPDGEFILRDTHMRKTHPEVGRRFDNMIHVLFDLRKTLREKEQTISILTKGDQ